MPYGLAMTNPCHASSRPATDAGSVPASRCGRVLADIRARAGEAFMRSAEPAIAPFGSVRPVASLVRCESWRWHGCASGFMAATVRRKQFPRRCAASSRSKFFSPPGSPLRFDRRRCSQPVPRRPDHNKDAMGANLVQPTGANIMANIGTFTADKDGFTGSLRTLTLNVKVKLVPNDKGGSENAPDFRLQAASHDIGAAWKKTSEAGREYLSVTLDDPSFPAPVYARLIEGENSTHDLIWSRSKPQAA
tara:strand:- start:7628 stop:8371 length:744 start_codon:yes stop_codon:yes gene_type:complete